MLLFWMQTWPLVRVSVDDQTHEFVGPLQRFAACEKYILDSCRWPQDEWSRNCIAGVKYYMELFTVHRTHSKARPASRSRHTQPKQSVILGPDRRNRFCFLYVWTYFSSLRNIVLQPRLRERSRISDYDQILKLTCKECGQGREHKSEPKNMSQACYHLFVFYLWCLSAGIGIGRCSLFTVASRACMY